METLMTEVLATPRPDPTALLDNPNFQIIVGRMYAYMLERDGVVGMERAA